jgi:hypothetical protein
LAGLTKPHGQRTYLVAVLSALVNVWFSGMRRPLSVLISVDFKYIVSALRSPWSQRSDQMPPVPLPV